MWQQRERIAIAASTSLLLLGVVVLVATSHHEPAVARIAEILTALGAVALLGTVVFGGFRTIED